MKIFISAFSVLCFLLFYGNEKELINYKEEVNKTLRKNSGMTELAPGEVAVINVWATWCGPCIQEIPEMNKIVKEYEGQNVRFLAFSDEQESTFKAFQKKRPSFEFDYETSFGNQDAIKLLKSLEKEYGGRAIPIHILIDKEGQVADVFIGASSTNIQKIKRFLNEHASAE
ncbi:TlpA family protein disulfide reductase [Mongoliibacter ruber]|uniref:AhpC/TSA family protein n=1 Tax=Mongoliibacter ruber TaxID=1750599 RepID=A0A2T0WQF9_9BACT|nr:TlpA disulfide reductase family protein [Mongoliibacter ruber]PRY88938.1 AhpC/TSA family protein [Mongoliibacter ruber]